MQILQFITAIYKAQKSYSSKTKNDLHSIISI